MQIGFMDILMIKETQICFQSYILAREKKILNINAMCKKVYLMQFNKVTSSSISVLILFQFCFPFFIFLENYRF